MKVEGRERGDGDGRAKNTRAARRKNSRSMINNPPTIFRSFARSFLRTQRRFRSRYNYEDSARADEVVKAAGEARDAKKGETHSLDVAKETASCCEAAGRKKRKKRDVSLNEGG